MAAFLYVSPPIFNTEFPSADSPLILKLPDKSKIGEENTVPLNAPGLVVPIPTLPPGVNSISPFGLNVNADADIP